MQNVLDGLCLDAVPAHFKLRVNSPEEVHALGLGVDLAFVASAVEASELRMHDELARGLLWQVAVTAGDVNPANAKLADLAMRERAKLVHLENDIGDVGERRADGNGFPRPQGLAARVRTRLRRPVGVDDLAPGAGPGLHQRARKGFASRHDIAANRIRQVKLGRRREGGEQHRRTEEYGDLGLAQDGDEVRTRSDLLLGEHDHGAARYPGAVHLRDATVVSE